MEDLLSKARRRRLRALHHMLARRDCAAAFRSDRGRGPLLLTDRVDHEPDAAQDPAKNFVFMTRRNIAPESRRLI